MCYATPCHALLCHVVSLMLYQLHQFLLLCPALLYSYVACLAVSYNLCHAAVICPLESCHALSRYTMFYPVISCPVILYCVCPVEGLSCHVLSVMLDMFCPVTLCYVPSCHVMSCPVVLCSALPCSVLSIRGLLLCSVLKSTVSYPVVSQVVYHVLPCHVLLYLRHVLPC